MKIIYLKNEGNIKRGEIKEAAEGYARNYLLPQGIAALATPENVAKVKTVEEKKIKEDSAQVKKLKLIAAKANGRKIEIKAKANELGKMYAAVSEADVKAAAERLGLNLSAARIIFDGHIKEPGEFKVKVDFGHKVLCNINLSVKL